MRATEAMLKNAAYADGHSEDEFDTDLDLLEHYRNIVDAALAAAPPDDAVTRVLEAAEVLVSGASDPDSTTEDQCDAFNALEHAVSALRDREGR